MALWWRAACAGHAHLSSLLCSCSSSLQGACKVGASRSITAVLPDQASASDRSASSRLDALDKSLAELKREQAALTEQWERERDDMRRLQSIKVQRAPAQGGMLDVQTTQCSNQTHRQARPLYIGAGH